MDKNKVNRGSMHLLRLKSRAGKGDIMLVSSLAMKLGFGFLEDLTVSTQGMLLTWTPYTQLRKRGGVGVMTK